MSCDAAKMVRALDPRISRDILEDDDKPRRLLDQSCANIGLERAGYDEFISLFESLTIGKQKPLSREMRAGKCFQATAVGDYTIDPLTW